MDRGMSGTDPWLEVCQELIHGKKHVRNWSMVRGMSGIGSWLEVCLELVHG